MEGLEEKEIGGPEEKEIGGIDFSVSRLIEEHLTVLDLSNKNIRSINENVKLPINLTELNLSNNTLREVPVSVLNLENIEILNLSHNCIKYFDETPTFYQTIQLLNISNNALLGPPYWIWSETPKNLSEINLSCNINITKSFDGEYFQELLEYKTLVTKLIIFNCKLDKYLELIGTFPNTKSLDLGTTDLSVYSRNFIQEVPCGGLNECCNIEYLNLANTNIYYVNSTIEMYKHLREINLSYNKLDSLPEEFCSLENLEVCILSYNYIYSLPAKFCDLRKLQNLSINTNVLYMLPDNICELPYIRRLDIYDNHLCELPLGIENVLEVDVALNYFEEPNNEEYLEKKKIIRTNGELRFDGRKVEEINPESDVSQVSTDDEVLQSSINDQHDMLNRSLSSPEDWESDEFWIPHLPPPIKVIQPRTWLFYVKKKMEEGNFCPMDAHTIPIADQVMYARMCNPKVEYESDGQFDDFSGDDS